MSVKLIIVLGFISCIVLSVFWWLIVLDLDIRKKNKELRSSKVKFRHHKKNNVYKIA